MFERVVFRLFGRFGTNYLVLGGCFFNDFLEVFWGPGPFFQKNIKSRPFLRLNSRVEKLSEKTSFLGERPTLKDLFFWSVSPSKTFFLERFTFKDLFLRPFFNQLSFFKAFF